MKGFRFVLPICIVLCAFVCVSVIREVQAMAKTAPPVPDHVVVSPSVATVVVGKHVNFTAAVYDSKNKKIAGVKLVWCLAGNVSDCSIGQNGVLTVAVGATPGTYSNLVKVAVEANSSIFSEAQVNIANEPFSGGVFIGAHDCTEGCADSGELAIHATATTFKALSLEDDGSSFQEFTGTIDKNGKVSAAFTTSDGHQIFITGGVTFSGGVATGLSGTWTQPGQSSSGTWTADAANDPGAGPKMGTWSTPGKTPPSGSLAAIFNDGYSFSCIAMSKDNGQLQGMGFSGTWNSDNINFTISGGTVTEGNGKYSPGQKAASGNLYSGPTKVGTWKISDL